MDKLNRDKRLQRLIKVGEKAGPLGFSLYKTTQKLGQPLKDLMVSYPNMTALFLNISDNAFEKGSVIFNNILEPSITDKGDFFEFNLENQDTHVFDFFENTIIAIVFAYTAIECLVNDLIPNSVRLITSKVDKVVILDKVFIERKLKLSEKIKNILPQVYKYQFNSNEMPFWSNFMSLEKYRNEFIHSKSNVLTGSSSTQIGFLSYAFLDIIQNDIIESARELIKYLTKKVEFVPGLPTEFTNQPIEIEKYRDHYKEKGLKENPNLTITFDNMNEFNKFKEAILDKFIDPQNLSKSDDVE